MKKLFAVMLLGSTILGTVLANDLKKENLLGKVHTLKEEYWSAVLKFGVYAKGEQISSKSYVYDDKGNKTEEHVYNAHGSYFYNLKGGYKAVEYKYTYTNTYDDKGNKAEWSSYNSDGSLEYKITYDDKGNWTEESGYNSDGSIIYKITYTYEYDHFGNWTSKTTSGQVNKFGKVYLEPTFYYSRKITYYP